VGRALGSKFQELLGQPAIVENKPGANGSIAAEFVAKSDPTAIRSWSVRSRVLDHAALFKDLRYNPLRDFAPLTLAVHHAECADHPARFACGHDEELVESRRRIPQDFLLLERTAPPTTFTGKCSSRARASTLCSALQGGAASRPTSWAKQIDISFQNLGAVTNYIKAGKMKRWH